MYRSKSRRIAPSQLNDSASCCSRWPSHLPRVPGLALLFVGSMRSVRSFGLRPIICVVSDSRSHLLRSQGFLRPELEQSWRLLHPMCPKWPYKWRFPWFALQPTPRTLPTQNKHSLSSPGQISDRSAAALTSCRGRCRSVGPCWSASAPAHCL